MNDLFRPLRRPALALGLPVLALAAPGCDDDRGEPQASSTVNGDLAFGVALVSTEALRVHNQIAERVLEVFEAGTPTPVVEPGCAGGTARITDGGDEDPATFAVTFTNYQCPLGIGLNISTNPLTGGQMEIRFLETSPGLVYTINLPYDLAANAPNGVSYQLPGDAGGFILQGSTPFGPLLCELEGPRGARHEGSVHVEGALRLEDRNVPLLVVEELDVEYAFDDAIIPKFADWPAGAFEFAIFQGGGGFGLGGAATSFPVNVFFDGFGGAAFTINDRLCQVDLAAGENPCEGL